MSQQVRFLKIKNKKLNEKGEIYDIDKVYKYLKSAVEGKDLEGTDEKLKQKLFESKDISFIINAYDPMIESIISKNPKYLLNKNTSIYLVDNELWRAITKNIRKEWSQSKLTFAEIAVKSKEMEKIEKIFNGIKLAIEIS